MKNPKRIGHYVAVATKARVVACVFTALVQPPVELFRCRYGTFSLRCFIALVVENFAFWRDKRLTRLDECGIKSCQRHCWNLANAHVSSGFSLCSASEYTGERLSFTSLHKCYVATWTYSVHFDEMRNLRFQRTYHQALGHILSFSMFWSKTVG